MGYTDFNTFLMFGDSITEYSFDQFPADAKTPQFALGSALQNAYARKLQILQRGFSGYTSREGIPLVRSILKAEHDGKPETKNIKLAYVFLGTNDARLKGTSPENKQHIPLDKYIENIKIIINEFKIRSIPVFLISPGLHDKNLWDKKEPDDLKTGDYRTNEVNKQYQDALVEAFKGDVPVLPLYDEMMSYIKNGGSEKALNEDYSDFLCDGVHFSGLGYKILYDAMIKLIDENFKHLSPEGLAYRFPHWTELTPTIFNNID